MSWPVLRAELALLSEFEGGRRTSLHDGYRGAVARPERREHALSVNDIIVLFEDREQLAPGQTAVARVWPLVPELTGWLVEGVQTDLMEGTRVIGRLRVLARLVDPVDGAPLTSMSEAKTRPLEDA